jgi:cysteine desulfurase
MADLFGFEVEMLPVNAYGIVDPDDVAKHIRNNTTIVSIMYANNEIGSINPIAEIGLICKDRGVAFHTDAVQGVAYLPTDVQSLNVDMLSIGAHKFYGPKGIGALYLRRGLKITPIVTGGKQENQLRAGTENIPYIIGMAEALRLANIERDHRTHHLIELRDHLIGNILENIQDSRLTGHPEMRLPNHASFVFKGVDGNELLMMLDIDGFACSSGSACKTGDPEPSEVLIAIGLERDWTLGSLRVTLGKDTQAEDIDRFINSLMRCVDKARKFS